VTAGVVIAALGLVAFIVGLIEARDTIVVAGLIGAAAGALIAAYGHRVEDEIEIGPVKLKLPRGQEATKLVSIIVTRMRVRIENGVETQVGGSMGYSTTQYFVSLRDDQLTTPIVEHQLRCGECSNDLPSDNLENVATALCPVCSNTDRQGFVTTIERGAPKVIWPTEPESWG
jgi:hypothetical protein